MILTKMDLVISIFKHFISYYDSSLCSCDDDADGDDVKKNDNCPFKVNTDQADDDQDGIGNLCDNCPKVSNAEQKDSDGDGKGDECDDDIDGDQIPNEIDECPKVLNFFI